MMMIFDEIYHLREIVVSVGLTACALLQRVLVKRQRVEATFLVAKIMHSLVLVFVVLLTLVFSGSPFPDDERTHSNFQLRLIIPSTGEIPLENQTQRFFDASIGVTFEGPRDINGFDSFCKHCTLCVGIARCVHLYDNSGDGFSANKPVKRLKVPVDAFQKQVTNAVNITLFNGWEPLASMTYEFMFLDERQEVLGQGPTKFSSQVFPEDEVDPIATPSSNSSSTSGIIPGLNLTFEYPPDGIVVSTPKMIITH